jgi:hypothetical protein
LLEPEVVSDAMFGDLLAAFFRGLHAGARPQPEGRT